jgi:uncharacterized membrane protein (DUF485 family)
MWVVKTYILRFNSHPPSLNLNFARPFINYLGILPLLYYFGVIVWEHGLLGLSLWGELNRWAGYSVGLFLILFVWALAEVYYFEESNTVEGDKSYSEVRHLFV